MINDSPIKALYILVQTACTLLCSNLNIIYRKIPIKRSWAGRNIFKKGGVSEDTLFPKSECPKPTNFSLLLSN